MIVDKKHLERRTYREQQIWKSEKNAEQWGEQYSGGMGKTETQQNNNCQRTGKNKKTLIKRPVTSTSPAENT